MEWMNYHHLLYFWTVATEGSITRAALRLQLAQPTVSGQLKQFEAALGERLFRRTGRRLTLTDTGQIVYRYADDIFSLGRELQDSLKGFPCTRPLRLILGIDNSFPSLIAHRLLQPLIASPEPVRLVCHQDSSERLLSSVSEYRLDVVLSTIPASSFGSSSVFYHLLGTSSTTLFAGAEIAEKYRQLFPASLDGAPFVMPPQGSGLRQSLDQWMNAENIKPLVAAEFNDSTLLHTVGKASAAIFCAPRVIEEEIQRLYEVAVVGRVESVIQRFYSISVQRRRMNPAVIALHKAAQLQLFPQGSSREGV